MSHFRTPEGVTLATLDWEGSGAPLYLMHATGFCGALWDPIARALTDLVAPRAMDERGHGASDKPDSDYSWARFADDLLAWIEHEDAERVFAAGHSSGATAVLLAAAREPERFARILLLDPVLLPPPGERNKDEKKGGFGLADRTLRRQRAWPSAAAMQESLRAKFPYSGFTDEIFDLYVKHALESRSDGGVALLCPPEIESRIYLGTAAVDPWEVMSSVRARTRILIPELTGIRGPFRKRLAETMPTAEIVRVPGTHFLPLERPDIVVEQAREFFG